MPNPSLLTALAKCFLGGEPRVEEIVSRVRIVLGRPWPWVPRVAQRYVEAVARRTRPRQRDVIQFLRQDPDFVGAWSEHFRQLKVERWLTEPQLIQPIAVAEQWNVLALDSAGALADWLWLDSGELEWFADLKGLGRKRCNPLLRHYQYRILEKRSGGIRLLEMPKPRLKEIQRQILARILDKVPSHPAAHGFIKGRSIETFVAPHVGQRVILRMDLREFFPSISGARIQTFFRMAGYPETIADLLGGLCTNSTPWDIWSKPGFYIDRLELREARDLYLRPHLPQGAPSSPALANICAYRLDCRLTGLAHSAGATYTRYADDLAFSGDREFEARVERFSTHVAAIALEEGFRVHYRKTRIMRKGVRQHLAGLVANERVNVMRTDFDLLKAILTNCVRRGPESQNREGHPFFRAHLEGRVGFMETINPGKGKRLRAILQQIEWQG
jgi:hypothetical protein